LAPTVWLGVTLTGKAQRRDEYCSELVSVIDTISPVTDLVLAFRANLERRARTGLYVLPG
jgi:hypothetical protein